MTTTAEARPPSPEDQQDRARPVGASLPEIVRRRLAPIDDRLDLYSWTAAGVVTLIAAIVRLVALDRPRGIIFDETYYAANGYGLLRYGVEWGAEAPVGSRTVTFSDSAAYVVHPPLGKWMIAVGEWIFGYNEVGWRVAGAAAGIASVLMITRITRRLFGSTLLGAAAGLLVALDGMHVVLSRTALLDIFLLFFLVAAFGALVLDRDARRRRWLRAMTNGLDPGRRGRAGRPAFDWRTGVPWWRLASAALLGCALAVKWSAVFYLPVFLVLMVVWEVGARRSAGVRRPWLDTILDETSWVLLAAAVVPLVYLASWTGWFATDHGYYRHWLADHGHSEPPVIGALRNLLHYHQEMLRFHTNLADSHVYQSWPWQWLLLARPVAFHWSGEGACGAPSCASEVLLLGTPLLWWSFLPALVALVWLGIARRDWRVAPILLGAAAGILPWFLYSERPMFYFYALPAEPFLVLAVVYVLGALMTPAPGESPIVLGIDRRAAGAVLAGLYVLAIAWNFAYFYPIYTAQLMSYEAWHARIWLPGRWV